MKKLFFLLIIYLFLLSKQALAQQQVSSFEAPSGWRVNNDAIAAFDSINQVYRINFQDGKYFRRRIYDTSFRLMDEYSFESKTINLLSSPTRLSFVAPLSTSEGHYDIYADDNELIVYQTNFQFKKDLEVFRLQFSNNAKTGENLLSILPDATDLKVLTYSKEHNTLNIYKWTPGQDARTYRFNLPEKSLDPAEEKKYSKACQIKLKTLWADHFSASRINSIHSLPKPSRIFYAGNKIYILIKIPYSMGYFMMAADIEKGKLFTHNFFINDLQLNMNGDYYQRMTPVSMIYDSTLVINNSSINRFEFLFYDVNNFQLLKKHTVPVEDSLFFLVNSGFTQKGTFGSRNEEKEIKNARAFMRKIEGYFWYINTTSRIKDDIVFTLSSLKQTSGIEGALLSLSTAMVGGLANLHVGNLQAVPYLTSSRYMLYFVHSRFNAKTLENSPLINIRTAIDEVIDKFESGQLSSSSSFVIQRQESVLIGVFNQQKGMYEVFKFANSKY